MRVSAFRIVLAAILFGWLPSASLSAGAQSFTNPGAPRHADTVGAAPSPGTGAPLQSRSPIMLFRELLTMDLAHRQKTLADRSPEKRRLILAKVREYESLRPDVRELRLRVTELRWYLWPLMNLTPTNRSAQLEHIPPNYRPLVEDRLREWDRLAPDVQKQLLENEATIRYFTELRDSPGYRTNTISAARRDKLERGIRQWQALSEVERRQIASRFNQFFGLKPEEKDKALETLSEPERAQIEKTLRSFGQLPPSQRIACIRSFEKFASLSLEERQQFLKNAERWKLMTPDERQAWRELVKSMPLLPSYLSAAPVPTTLPPRARPAAVATNGG